MATATVAQKPATAAPPASKGKLGSVLLLVVGLLLGAGGGFAGAKFLLIAKPAETASAPVKADEEKPVEASKEPRHFLPFKPYIVNIRDKSFTRYFKVTIGVETNNKEVIEELGRLAMPVNDFMVERLSAVRIEEIDGTAGRNRLKRELMEGLNALLETGYISKMYFSEFIVQ